MPLLLISSVNPFGRTYVVACCLLHDETIMSYQYALQSFVDLFKPLVPRVDTIITDQDNALMNAIKTVFPGAAHQLCWWHLQANIRKNFASNTTLCNQFSAFIKAPTEDKAEEIFAEMLEGRSSREMSYLLGLHRLRDKFVEAWVSRYKNMGMRSSQRAESINRVFKDILNMTGAPLVKLFDVFTDMTSTCERNDQISAFQLRDKQRLLHPYVRSVSGQIPDFILQKVEEECKASDGKTIVSIEDDVVIFSDSSKVLLERQCDCPFFAQFAAPCSHLFKIYEEAAVNMFHQGWMVHRNPTAQLAIMYGPRQTVQLSKDDGMRVRLSALSSEFDSYVQAVDYETRVDFYEKFNEMLRQGTLDSVPEIRDPTVTKPRGRPRKRAKNNFKGSIHRLLALGGQNIAL